MPFLNITANVRLIFRINLKMIIRVLFPHKSLINTILKKVISISKIFTL